MVAPGGGGGGVAQTNGQGVLLRKSRQRWLFGRLAAEPAHRLMTGDGGNAGGGGGCGYGTGANLGFGKGGPGLVNLFSTESTSKK